MIFTLVKRQLYFVQLETSFLTHFNTAWIMFLYNHSALCLEQHWSRFISSALFWKVLSKYTRKTTSCFKHCIWEKSWGLSQWGQHREILLWATRGTEWYLMHLYNHFNNNEYVWVYETFDFWENSIKTTYQKMRNLFFKCVFALFNWNCFKYAHNLTLIHSKPDHIYQCTALPLISF